MIGIVTRSFRLALARQTLRGYRFSSSVDPHEDHHGNHYEVKLDRETNWATYNNVLSVAILQPNNKFVSLYGYTDTHPAKQN